MASCDQSYALLEALVDKQQDCSPLFSFLGRCPDEGCDRPALLEMLDVFTPTQLELFWSKTNELAVICVATLGLAEDSDEEIRDGVAGSIEWAECIEVLSKIADIAFSFSEDSKLRPKSLFTTLVTLHDVLTLLNSEDGAENRLQHAIASSCESWWLREEHGRELVVTQLIAYFLLCGVEHDQSDVYVKKLYGIKTAFQLLDFDDDSIESIRGLLLRCFVHPRFLKVIWVPTSFYRLCFSSGC